MHPLKRLMPQLLALACAAFTIQSVHPDSPLFATEEARLQSIRVQAQMEEVLSEAPPCMNASGAVVTSPPWQYSPTAQGRTLAAIAPTHDRTASVTACTSPVLASAPRMVWWKHRRYVCQRLDMPPPCVPSSAAL